MKKKPKASTGGGEKRLACCAKTFETGGRFEKCSTNSIALRPKIRHSFTAGITNTGSAGRRGLRGDSAPL